jgi:hypothetical protein
MAVQLENLSSRLDYRFYGGLRSRLLRGLALAETVGLNAS